MRPDKHFPKVVMAQQSQNKLLLPQLNNKYQAPLPFSPNKFNKIKLENFKKYHIPIPQAIQQQRKDNIKKIRIFQLREAMNNQAYLQVLKKLQKNHKYRQKILQDHAMNAKRLNQLLKSVQQSETIKQIDRGDFRGSNKFLCKQKVKTQQRSGKVYSIGLDWRRKQSSLQLNTPDLNYPSNIVTAPKIQKKSHKSFRQIIEAKNEHYKRINSHVTKSFRNPFVINQLKNQQLIGKLINQQELLSLRSPTQSLSTVKTKNRQYYDRQAKQMRRQKMSIQHMQQNQKHEKARTDQNYIQGWGTNQDQVAYYF